ncbi:MAG: thiosulfate oxidation carrier protein SoxY, partial [Tepidimonas fonticaldi]|nr:thiosulfate oxidation carrier protein SoxY [Tepidimonas fonticaldi]
MKQNRRAVLKAGGALATLVSLGVVTAEQALASGRDGFAAKTLADALKAVGGQPATSDQVQ